MSTTGHKLNVIQFLGRIPLLGSCLRWLARRYPEGSVTQIRSGVASGLMWRRHHRYVSGYWLGHYELALQEKIAELLKPGDTFFDVGANGGFFSLIGASRVGTSGRCVAFEPLPENAASILEQFQANSITHGDIFEGAIASRVGRVLIAWAAQGDSQAHMTQCSMSERILEVSATTLDEAAERYGVPQVVKIDIEGAEAEALRGAQNLLRCARTFWIIEVHSSAAWRDCRTALLPRHEIKDLSDQTIQEVKTFPFHMVASPQKR